MTLDDDTRADLIALVENITIALEDDTMPVLEVHRLLRWRQRLQQYLNHSLHRHG